MTLGAPGAWAQSFGSGDAPLDITADSLEFEQNRLVYVAKGNVVISQQGRTLTADWVAFNNNTRHGLASGNVQVVDGEDILYADFLQFNVDTLRGVVFDGTLTDQAKGFRLEGSEIRKTGEESYEFDDGVFTTCACPDEGRDPWAIESKEADVDVGGYAVTKNTTLNVLGVPVFWLPRFMYPVANERASGFLLPEFSQSNRGGVELGLPFFWAARDNVNVTVTPAWMSKRGFFFKGEVDYVFGREDYGEAQGFYMPDDDEVDEDGNSDTPFDSERWGIEWEHSQVLSWWDLRFKTFGVQVSDNEVPFDFRQLNSWRRDRFLPSLGSVTKQFGPTSPWGGWLAVRWADDVQNPDNDDRDDFLLQRMPEIALSQMTQPLPFADRVFTSMDVQYIHFWRQDDPEDELPTAVEVDDIFLDTGTDALPNGQERNEDGNIVTAEGIVLEDGTLLTAEDVLAANPDIDPMLLADRFNVDQAQDDFLTNGGPEGNGRFDEGEPLSDKGHRLLVNPRVSVPFRATDWLEVLPELGYHGTFYQSDNNSFEHRSLGTAQIDLRTRMHKMMDLPGGVVAQHLVEPRLSYYAIAELSDDDDNPLFIPDTAVSQERIRQFTLENQLRDPADRIDHRHGIALGVSQRFYTVEPDPLPEEMDPDAREDEDEEELWVPNRLWADVTTSVEYRFDETEFGWWVVDGTLYPTDFTRVRTNFGYDLNDMQVAEGLFEIGVSTLTGNDLRVRYRYIRDIPRFFEDFNTGDRFDDFESGFSRINQVEFGFRWAATPNWALLYDIRYSFEQEITLTNRGGIEYISKCRCWAARVTVADDRSGGFNFGFEYALLGLGDDTVRPFSAN